MRLSCAFTCDDRVALDVDEMTFVPLDHGPACQLERSQHAAVDLDVVTLGERPSRRRCLEKLRRDPAIAHLIDT